MKKELFLLLALSLLILASGVFSQNETVPENKPVTPAVKEVSLCDGCLTTDDACLEIGTQKQELDKGITLYCSSGKKLEMTKEAGENCNNDFECLSYTCEEGLCFEEIKEEGEGLQIIFVLEVIIFGGLIFFIIRFLTVKKTTVKEEKKTEKKVFETQEPKQEYTYEYRPEFDVLEKKLKKSLGKTKK